MMAMSGEELVCQAIEDAQKRGYRAHRLDGDSTGRGIFGLGKRKPVPTADILVEHGEKSAVIEVKTATPLLGAVWQTREYGDYSGAQAILCVPDSSFERIPESVREYADRVSVRLCPVSQIGETLKDLLE